MDKISDCLSRSDAIADFEKCNRENPVWTPQRVKTLLMRIPTADAVPVVRCRDCISYDPVNSSNWCSHPKGLCNPGESDFCSYGQAPTNSAPLIQEERWLKTV